MKKGVCIYFCGVMTDQPCKAGVDLRAHVGGDDFGWMKRIPCLASNGENAVSCDLYQEPTDKQIAEHEAEIEAYMAGVMKATEIIQEKHNVTPNFEPCEIGTIEGCSGEIDCPVCGSPLAYSVAPGNGHIWGRCTTEGCITWAM